jgi:hypothetical protein
MDDLNPADFTALQPYFDSMRVKRGLRKKVLDDASGLSPSVLVLFKDNGNICSTRNVTSVPSIHEIYPLHRLVKNFVRATYHNKPEEQQNHPRLEEVQGDAGVCPLSPSPARPKTASVNWNREFTGRNAQSRQSQSRTCPDLARQEERTCFLYGET